MKMMLTSGNISSVLYKRKDLLAELQSRGVDITLAGYETGCEDKCDKAHLGYAYVPMSRAGLNPFADLNTIRCFHKVIRAGKYDVVHSYTAKPNIYSAIAARMAGVKKIYPTINGLGYAFTNNDLKTKLIRFYICLMYRIAFACADKVFFQNQDDADELVARHVIRREKCVVIAGSGIDLAQFPFSEVANHGTFLMATRLLITKGVRTYIEAARLVKQKHPEAVFQLAGGLDPNPDGLKQEELDACIADGTIEYLGHVSDMPGALSRCAAFVLPSWYREGVPHAVLEAMSTGRAVITANTPGCKDTINGKNGFLIEPRDVNALAEKMTWMLEHPEETAQMGREGYEYAKEKFEVSKVNGMMLEAMDLGQSGGQA